MRVFHWIVVLVLIVASDAVSAQTSGAPDFEELTEILSEQGFFVDDGLDVATNGLAELVADYPRTRYVVVGQNPQGGASNLAAELLAALDAGTVVVITPTEMGAASRDHSSSAVGEALTAALEDDRADEVADFVEFSGRAGPDARPGPPWGLVLAVLVAVILLALAGRTLLSRRPDGGDARRLEERRAEVRQRLTFLGDDMSVVATRIGAEGDAGEHYRTAADLFAGAEAELATASSKSDCDALVGRLDTIRSELDSAVQLVSDGSASAPAGSACFFDPTHGSGAVPASVVGSDGVVTTAWVCGRDAETLRNGERPRPRMITVAGRKLAAPIAPRTHGGGGLSGLDTFTIALEGMGAPARYRFASGKGRWLRPNGTRR